MVDRSGGPSCSRNSYWAVHVSSNGEPTASMTRKHPGDALTASHDPAGAATPAASGGAQTLCSEARPRYGLSRCRQQMNSTLLAPGGRGWSGPVREDEGVFPGLISPPRSRPAKEKGRATSCLKVGLPHPLWKPPSPGLEIPPPSPHLVGSKSLHSRLGDRHGWSPTRVGVIHLPFHAFTCLIAGPQLHSKIRLLQPSSAGTHRRVETCARMHEHTLFRREYTRGAVAHSN